MKKRTMGVWVVAVVLLVVFTPSMVRAETETRTPREAEAISVMQKGRVVFLCFYNETDPNFSTIKSNIDAIADNFQAVVYPVYVMGSDKAEDKFREKLTVPAGETVAFVVMPNGKAVARLEGSKITKENLMRPLVSSCGSGCASGCGQ